jgi:hypothetical protein
MEWICVIFELSKVREDEMNLRTLTIICHCDEREIELAVSGFHATIIRREAI